MSAYSFIASDYELPEIENTKARTITVQEAIKLGIKPHELVPWEEMNPDEKILYFEQECDLYELVIRKDSTYDKNVSWYTQKPFIYTIEFRYTDSRGSKLLEYLKKNLKIGHSIELWSIWLDDKQSVEPVTYDISEISLEHLKQLYDWRIRDYMKHICMVISGGKMDKP